MSLSANKAMRNGLLGGNFSSTRALSGLMSILILCGCCRGLAFSDDSACDIEFTWLISDLNLAFIQLKCRTFYSI